MQVSTRFHLLHSFSYIRSRSLIGSETKRRIIPYCFKLHPTNSRQPLNTLLCRNIRSNSEFSLRQHETSINEVDGLILKFSFPGLTLRSTCMSRGQSMSLLLRLRVSMATYTIICAFCFTSMLTVLSGTTPSFVVEALQVRVNSRVTIQPSPLIGGPSWLPVHCKIIVDDSHIFDFIPLNAASTETIRKLITLKPVPATARIIQKEKKNRIHDSCNKRSDDDDELEKMYVERAVQFCQEYEQDLHLVRNNCWSFAFDLLRDISQPESTRGTF